MKRISKWVRESIKWRTARRRLKISAGLSGASASKLADAICEIAENLNRVVTPEEIEAVSAVLKGKLMPITHPEVYTVRIKPSIISWEAAEVARKSPQEAINSEIGPAIAPKISVGNTAQYRASKTPSNTGDVIRIKL